MHNLDLFRHTRYVLDASSAINLYASGHMGDIIRSVPVRIAISTYVKDYEAQNILELPDCNGVQQSAPIDLDSLVSSGELELIFCETSSIASTVIVLSDAGIRGMGEKISGAIALENGWGLILDDKHATAKLTAHLPHIQMLTTLDLVKYWSEQRISNNGIVRQVLQNIRSRGNYIVPKDHLLHSWASSYGEVK